MTGSAVSSSASQASPRSAPRRFPIGAEYLEHGQSDVRVWAPAATRVDLVVESGATTPLQREDGGYFRGLIDAEPGARYRFRLDTADQLLPDPVSRFQPEGPHGPSEIVDPRAFAWTDDAWTGARRAGQVVYEMH